MSHRKALRLPKPPSQPFPPALREPRSRPGPGTAATARAGTAGSARHRRRCSAPAAVPRLPDPRPESRPPAPARLPGHSPSGEQVEQRAGLRHGPAAATPLPAPPQRLPPARPDGATAEGAGGELREEPGLLRADVRQRAHTAPLAPPRKALSLKTNKQRPQASKHTPKLKPTQTISSLFCK